MAYIDRDSLCDYYQERFDFLFKNSIKKNSVGYTIDKEIQTAAVIAKEFLDKAKQAPTADVVEVVRCKDCKESYTTKDGKLRCEVLYPSLDWVEPNDFCSYGRKKGE